ncbi:MAG: YidC/Oxa1 family membrane protein insertase [Phenylobacterium sp.]|jgi:YidC/Oxa1 family membrane protein insertase
MESQRTFIFIALMLVSFLLFQQWQEDYHPKAVVTPAATSQSFDEVGGNRSAASADIPASAGNDTPALVTEANRYITVKTNVLSLIIDTKGGDVIGGDLLGFPVEQGEAPLVALLSKQHKAQSGLIGRDGPDGSRQGRPQYAAEQQDYTVTQGEAGVTVPMTWVNAQGLKVTKVFTIKPNEYDIAVDYIVANNSTEIKSVQTFAQLKKIIPEPESTMMMNAYNQATYSTTEEVYEKYDLDDMMERNLSKTTKGGWVAMQQHYFVAAWVPTAAQQNMIYSKAASDGSAIIGFKGPEVDIQPGQSQTIETVLYVGPKNQETLQVLSDSLGLTVDYGPLWFISKVLFTLMNFLHGLVGNWGFAIILITIIVKSLLYPLTKKQIISGVRMRALQPKIEQLKERFGDDKAKMGPAMMELYKKEKVNPVSGCLPLLLQMPIFLALYWMLMESVELRHAEFIFWITDLSSKDPYFLLPVLYGVSMFVMQKLTPTPSTDPMQQKVLTWMPVFFSVLFVVFPSGLVLYWVINNIMQILQTLYIQKKMENETAKLAKTTS